MGGKLHHRPRPFAEGRGFIHLINSNFRFLIHLFRFPINHGLSDIEADASIHAFMHFINHSLFHIQNLSPQTTPAALGGRPRHFTESGDERDASIPHHFPRPSAEGRGGLYIFIQINLFLFIQLNKFIHLFVPPITASLTFKVSSRRRPRQLGGADRVASPRLPTETRLLQTETSRCRGKNAAWVNPNPEPWNLNPTP